MSSVAILVFLMLLYMFAMKTMLRTRRISPIKIKRGVASISLFVLFAVTKVSKIIYNTKFFCIYFPL